VQERLLGDWISLDDKETMKVRRLDDNTYIVYFDGDLFRAYHSDVPIPLLSAFRISTLATASSAYLAWNLSDDGKYLRLRSVQSKLMPKEQKDSARVSEVLKEKAKSPELFGEEIQFSRVK
jgi:hypothetical protein